MLSLPHLGNQKNFKNIEYQAFICIFCLINCIIFHMGFSCCCSLTKSHLTLWNPMDCITLDSPFRHCLLEFAQIHVHWVGDTICVTDTIYRWYGCLILCCPLLLPSMFPNIRVFSNESSLCIRWASYWSFRFSTSPSNEYSGLIYTCIYYFSGHFPI